MEISRHSASLLADEHFLSQLSDEILTILRSGSSAQYLDTISRLALNSKYTSTLFVTHEPIFVEICSRWLTLPDANCLSAIAALARILPSAPYLSVFAKVLLNGKRHGALVALATPDVIALQELPHETLHELLVALCRLLKFDNEDFASWVSPAQLQILLRHASRPVRYLAIKILCLYLHASDAVFVDWVKIYIEEGVIEGSWEEKSIDYTFFTLWEDQRLEDLALKVQTYREALNDHDAGNKLPNVPRFVESHHLSKTSACVGGVLIPLLGSAQLGGSFLAMTATMTKNLSILSEGIKTSKPLLVTGLSGSGKTLLIGEMARKLGKSDSMITLHLNEQSDAKLLIGLYTSTNSTGSFTWSPGLLTTAVEEGRWVVVEDLDRAPTEIISTLLPLIERRELLIPNQGETRRAAPGFKLIATVRSMVSIHGEEVSPLASPIGLRHWLKVPFQMPSNLEFAEIIRHKFSILHTYIPGIMELHANLSGVNSIATSSSAAKPNMSRSHGPRDLLRWCRRIAVILEAAGVVSGYESISDATNDHVFLEAVDCFAGALPSGPSKVQVIEAIAQALHMPSKRMEYCLKTRNPEYYKSDSLLRIGRASVRIRSKPSSAMSSRQYNNHGPFAMTEHVLRMLESVTMAVKQREPCLLVGETGAGKTTIVQRLAGILDHELIVVNLSQQSEVGDLLGGYKPVNPRALAVPLKEEFDELLQLTLPSQRNRHYIDTLHRSFRKSQWSRVLTLWQEALRTIDPHFNWEDTGQIPPSKKRKLQSPMLIQRWKKFSADVLTFQNHIASASGGPAISFVEGNIVRAARNGDWVLLDEINLASPDTLESLTDLFSNGMDSSPSLLLSETGDPERVYAHKDFRIFGAMNPATDIGKRDLPQSIRSRFTELYVEAPDKDLESLVPVVKLYLGNHSEIDVHAANDVSRLYLEIRQLVESNRIVDGANQKPHFSLRTLTRTLGYATGFAASYGLRRALFEGFSMSFTPILSRESELLLQPLIDKCIFGAQKNRKASANQRPRLPSDGKSYVRFRHYWIAQGAHSVQEQSHYIITPFIERNLLNLVRATSTRKFPILLQGPTSSGKTSMIQYLARISGNKFVRINNHEHTDLQEYLGNYVSSPDGRLQYQEGILVQALREGHWVVLDELNLAPTDVLEALNRLLDDNRELLIPETQQVVRPHANFMLFATQNPPGMYGGRKILSRAFRNRFLELHFDDIPEDELGTILRERSQIAPPFCAKIVDVYRSLSALRQTDRVFEQKNSFATLRDLFRWAFRTADDKEQLATNGFFLLTERVRNNGERLAVKHVIEDVMKVKVSEDHVYNFNRLLSPASTTQGIVWTHSMRRLYVLITEALRNCEPVLLIGETGSGKTTICQAIAEIMNTQLRVVNAHQNMETGDLVGAQRPMRNRAAAQAQLVRELIDVLTKHGAYQDEFGEKCDVLLEAYEDLKHQAPGKLSDEVCLRINESRTRANALFEWVDGGLVNAMRQGHHFLLDEISLADDSVLERLNSVLETDRTLFLAEKGSTDALVSASPGFQFLATMNPGGDYGKRELSPALRNRFTEIWVPNVVDDEELLEIVKAKISPSCANLPKSMVDFAAWYADTYSAASPSISIRDLLAWTHFINRFEEWGRDFSLLQGAAMVYIDRLGANPAAKTAIAESTVPHERQACLLKLSELFGLDMCSMNGEKCELSINAESFTIGHFSVSRFSHSIITPNYSMRAPTTLSNVMKVMRALQLQKPILLEGSPGVGKTSLVAALAQAIGRPLTRINLSDQTDLMDLFGSDVPLEGEEAGRFGWRDAPFLRAMQNGEWVLLDEMNLASQAVLEGLNACLDHRGKIYVSELDQTFIRHPNFVVFAAQNPHHQGGGRKGLPASFVNRFTVVYAETFGPEDLRIICNEMFPDFPTDVTEKLVRCVTDMNYLLETDQRIGAHGGSWEINLRDILRWHHLLRPREGATFTQNPTDYENLLFLHRFRTPEDVGAVAKIIHAHLPPSDLCHSYFHCQDPRSLQVGLGVLTKDKLRRPVPIQQLSRPRANLPVTESVMLCVQNNWPCLLVGSSGSGKSSLLLQLASAVGADIVEISLSSGMDTMDLVGGYEQFDAQREVTRFLKQLSEYTERTIMDGLSSGTRLTQDLTEVERMLEVEADLSKLSALLRNLAREQQSSRYPLFLQECEGLIQKATIDTRARFEWVDGILVKALKQGKWLVLDNANLCSPSVLDRLNSLLEPEGFLNINEHRKPDGSAEIVKPHPSFRLFLTMDPRHGELSRAMRNRSIELFMPIRSLSPASSSMVTDVDITVSPFQFFQAFDWNNDDDARLVDLLTICLDHLAISDFQLCNRWQEQIQKGLISLSPAQMTDLSHVIKIFQQIISSDGMIIQSIRGTYNVIGNAELSSQDMDAMQPIQPLNNCTLLALRALPQQLIGLQSLGGFFEILVDICDLGQRLASVRDHAKSNAHSQLSRLERSLVSLQSTRFKEDSTQPLANFLDGMALFLRDMVNDRNLYGTKDMKDILPFAKEVLFYLRDLFDLAQSPDLEGTVFQAYHTIGKSIATRDPSDQWSQSLRSTLARELALRLDSFDVHWQLYTGLGMERLWSAFKPSIARETEELTFSLRIKELADIFDSSKWSSDASIQELEAVGNSIVRIHNTTKSAIAEAPGSLEDIEKALQGLQHRSRQRQTYRLCLFQSQFEILTQYDAYQSETISMESPALFHLLAGRPTKALMGFGQTSKAWGALSQLQRMTGVGQSPMELAVIRQILPLSTLHRMAHVAEVSLSSLGSVVAEVEVLAKSIADRSDLIGMDPWPQMDRWMEMLSTEVHDILGAQPAVIEQDNIKENLQRLPYRINEKTMDVRRHRSKLEIAKAENLFKAFQCVVRPTSSTGHLEIEYDDRSLTSRASTLVQFFTGCLLLYVPDRPFDPALRLKVERHRHIKREKGLQNKLQAHRDFERVFSGQASSLRMQMAMQSLETLGAEPEVPAVMRPRISELGQLQGEFNNILKTIVLNSPDPQTLQAVLDSNYSYAREIELLRQNITTSITRLSTGFLLYEDITRPVVLMLQGLNVGLAISLLADVESVPSSKAIKFICEATPFLGARPHDLLSKSLADGRAWDTKVYDPRFLLLESAAVARIGEDGIESNTTGSVFQVFHSFYEEWQEQLGQDQRRNAVKSSFYRYRGSEEESDEAEADEQEIAQLFPNYNQPLDENIRFSIPQKNPRLLAQRLAGLQREMFKGSRDITQRLLAVLQTASDDIADLWDSDSVRSINPVPSKTMISALILSLDHNRQKLRGDATSEALYNFYTDPNISQAQKLVSLVRKVQARFVELQEAWPEHATLEDVLRTSSELLALRHIEPVAKMLTKAEQLHGYMHEWQTVASRELTAAALCNQLTDLLVSWRRLELSTWARLLDMEVKKCADDSDSWWFVAYEVIIAVPLSVVDSEEDLITHARHLFSALEEFLATTSIGQYEHRLEMIDCFARHLNLLAVHQPLLHSVHNAISNFLSYYRRFEPSIQETLRTGHQDLEKDMKEILLLASWKNTNIIALRDSAKRSHHKLFKVIRKYRTLLSRPAETVLAQGIAPNANGPDKIVQRYHIDKVVEVDVRALKVCQQQLIGWHEKPLWFREPRSTSQKMLRESKIHSAAIDSASYLDNFAYEIVETMKLLQKETPPQATNENNEAIRRLKVRKRALYSETLNSIRKMGFRSNLSADRLDKQSSIAIILSKSPAFTKIDQELDLSNADCHFHRMLNIMPRVKEHSRNHSEDLTNGEVSRSIGYLESILSVIIKQRTVLAASAEHLDSLELNCKTLENLWAPDIYDLQPKGQSEMSLTTGGQWVMRLLPGILETGCVVIEKHSNLSGMNAGSILKGLRHWRDRMSTNMKLIDELPRLPPNLSSSLHAQNLANGYAEIQEFKTQLATWIEDSPKLSYVLYQIELWTKIDVTYGDHHINRERPFNMTQFNESTASASSTVLKAIEGLRDELSSLPSSIEYPKWLVVTDTCLANSLNKLHPLQVNKVLNAVMSQMSEIEISDLKTLNVASAACAMAVPIVRQYCNIYRSALIRYAKFHTSLCNVGSVLAHSFSRVTRDGFCSPAENPAAEAGKTEKLEDGTGLGEGDGAEDISKDIQDDEDLSELAQDGRKAEDKEEIEDQEDAVNMDHDDLEGEIGDVSEKGEESQSGSEGDENDIDQETGDVDDLDPSAVDEKLWDGNGEETEKDKEGSKAKGERKKEEKRATDEKSQQEHNEAQENDGEEDISQDGSQEDEQVAHQEAEKMNPHALDEQKLDLPEEMDLDNIEDSETISGSESDDMDDVSEVDQVKAEDDDIGKQDLDEQYDEDRDDPAEQQAHFQELDNESEDGAEGNDACSPVDTEPEEGKDDVLRGHTTDDAANDQDDVAPSEAQGMGGDTDQLCDQEENQESKARGNKGTKGGSPNPEDLQASTEGGEHGSKAEKTERAQTDDDLKADGTGSQDFKQLGDALEKWHRQQRQIRIPSEQAPEQSINPETTTTDIDMVDQEFEHLQNEEGKADAQALGPATNDQAKALNEKALESGQHEDLSSSSLEDVNEGFTENHDELMEDATTASSKEVKQPSRPGALIGNSHPGPRQPDQPNTEGLEPEEDIKDLDNDFSATSIHPESDVFPRSAEEARRLWFHYENLTRDLSLSLTEQLRLILAPTLATKMRGDFRTGKRLNIKRIIPYIASQYKRDKIWMRRSIPSKRNYQIMLAVDDSKSMGESGSGQLAFETLSLVTKSLSMLEVGGICVVGFGKEVVVAHEFDKPFSSEAGAQIFQHFGFRQTETNVRRLVADSITLFREARSKSYHTSTDPWQVELIISDGVCEDHEAIRRLVRQAQEERIMIVFVIVDALHKEESIMDMKQAVFEPDPTGESRPRIKRYLDSFPFPYYLVVGQVRDLPAVLAQALRQWFSEVAESE